MIASGCTSVWQPNSVRYLWTRAYSCKLAISSEEDIRGFVAVCVCVCGQARKASCRQTSYKRSKTT